MNILTVHLDSVAVRPLDHLAGDPDIQADGGVDPAGSSCLDYLVADAAGIPEVDLADNHPDSPAMDLVGNYLDSLAVGLAGNQADEEEVPADSHLGSPAVVVLAGSRLDNLAAALADSCCFDNPAEDLVDSFLEVGLVDTRLDSLEEDLESAMNVAGTAGPNIQRSSSASYCDFLRLVSAVPELHHPRSVVVLQGHDDDGAASWQTRILCVATRNPRCLAKL